MWLEMKIAMAGPTEDDSTRQNTILSLQDELTKKSAEIATIKAKYDNVVFVFIVFVVGLVAGKMLM